MGKKLQAAGKICLRAVRLCSRCAQIEESAFGDAKKRAGAENWVEVMRGKGKRRLGMAQVIARWSSETIERNRSGEVSFGTGAGAKERSLPLPASSADPCNPN